MSKKIKTLLFGFILSLFVWIGVGLLHHFRIFEGLQFKLSHFLYQERPLNEDILIVAIDESSLLSPSEGGLGSISEWKRSYYAEVLTTISEGDPRLVELDFIFRTFDEDSGEDSALRQALAKLDDIFLIKLVQEIHGFQDGTVIVSSDLKSAPEFSEKATEGYASSLLLENQDSLSVAYGIPLFFEAEGQIETHITFKIAQSLDPSLQAEEVPLEDGLMLLNFSGEAFTYPMVSFSDVYHGHISSEIFKDKIVLIGVTAQVLHDNWPTPIDSDALMPGIEIQANAIQMLLDRAFLTHQTGTEFWLVSAITLLLLTFIFLRLRLWATSLIFILAGLFFFLLYVPWRFQEGVIIDLIWLPFGVISSYLLTLLYRNFTEFKEKRQLKLSFSRYLSPELVEEIAEHPEKVKLGGERRDVTALFLDMQNFTTLSESKEPEEVISLLNLYFGAFAELIMEQGGMIDKFEGDAIMALFGAPLPCEDHSARACKTALLLQEKIQELNSETGLDLNIRIGIASGPAVVGNTGSMQRFDYTALGDTINTASRLEGANKELGTHILVNSICAKAVENSFVLRSHGAIQLKGKQNLVEVYELVGIQ